MSEREWHKGTPASCSALILGEVFADGRPPVTISLRLGQRAYEGYQIAAYLEGLLLIRHDPTYVDWSPLFGALYAGLVASGARRVVEIGPTLFATIDKLEKLQRLTSGPPVDDVEYVGVEPSALFRQLADALHPNARIVWADTVTDDAPSVSRCYQATSYAFDSTDDLVVHCARSAFGLHGLWTSADGTTRHVSVMGKRVTLFSVPAFTSAMQSRGYRVDFIQKSRSVHLNDFEYLETWVVFRHFTAEQETRFQTELARVKAVTRDSAVLFATYEDAPLLERADPATTGRVDGSETFDFTSPHTLARLAEWQASLRDA